MKYLPEIVATLTAKGVLVKFIEEYVEFTEHDSPRNNLLPAKLCPVAEFEYWLLLERQNEDIAIAKAKGKCKDSKPKLKDDKVAELKAWRAAGESPDALARECGLIHRAMGYSYAK